MKATLTVYSSAICFGNARADIFNITTGTGLSCIVAGLVYLLLAQIPSIKKYLTKDKAK